jgi:hypothetical protein
MARRERLSSGAAWLFDSRLISMRPLHGPAQAKLNQQHQHNKGLASIRLQLGQLQAGYSVSVFRGCRLDLGTCSATLRNCAGFAAGRQSGIDLTAWSWVFDGSGLNFCLIKHLHDRAGEKHYRCEARPRGCSKSLRPKSRGRHRGAAFGHQIPHGRRRIRRAAARQLPVSPPEGRAEDARLPDHPIGRGAHQQGPGAGRDPHRSRRRAAAAADPHLGARGRGRQKPAPAREFPCCSKTRPCWPSTSRPAWPCTAAAA